MDRTKLRLGLGLLLPIAGALLAWGAGTAQPVNYLPEGSMTDGGATPAGWSTPTAESGEVSATRDTAVFKQGPAGLRLDLTGAGAKGSAARANRAIRPSSRWQCRCSTAGE